MSTAESVVDLRIFQISVPTEPSTLRALSGLSFLGPIETCPDLYQRTSPFVSRGVTATQNLTVNCMSNHISLNHSLRCCFAIGDKQALMQSFFDFTTP